MELKFWSLGSSETKINALTHFMGAGCNQAHRLGCRRLKIWTKQCSPSETTKSATQHALPSKQRTCLRLAEPVLKKLRHEIAQGVRVFFAGYSFANPGPPSVCYILVARGSFVTDRPRQTDRETDRPRQTDAHTPCGRLRVRSAVNIHLTYDQAGIKAKALIGYETLNQCSVGL